MNETPSPVSKPPVISSEATDESSPLQTPLNTTSPPKSKQAILLLVLVLGIIILGGVVWLVYIKQQTHTVSITSQTAHKIPTAIKQLTATNIVYASQKSSSDPTEVYRLSLTDKVATPVSVHKQSGTSDYPSSFVSYGESVAFVSSDGIYYSSDDGTTYTNVYPLDLAKLADDQAVTSMHFSTSGKLLVFALLPRAGEKNTVKSLDLKTKMTTDLKSFDAGGVFILSYDDSSKILIYQTGCFFCDGTPKYPHRLDITTGQDSALVQPDSSTVVNNFVVSPNGKELLYYVGGRDPADAEQNGFVGWPGSPPYAIVDMNVATGKTTQLATAGVANQKDSNGKLKDSYIQVGFTADDGLPYYSVDGEIFISAKAGAPLASVYTAKRTIYSLAYVSKTELLLTTDASSDKVNTRGETYTSSAVDYYHYDFTTKKESHLAQITDNTTTFVVTSKLVSN